MKFTAYVVEGRGIEIRPAPVERPWMDATSPAFAARLARFEIANAHGWEVLCPSGFSAVWDGGADPDAIRIYPDSGTIAFASSEFGNAILSLDGGCVFRTDPGYDLIVSGPVNHAKDGIAALSAVIEPDGPPEMFAMQWVFTRTAQRVRFEKGEPFCHVFPIRRDFLETVEPEMRALTQAPDLVRAVQGV